MPLQRSASLQNLVQSQYVHEQVSRAAPQKPSIAQAAFRFANVHTSSGCGNIGVGHLSAIKSWTPSLPDADEVDDIIHASRQKRRKYNFEDYISEVKKVQVGNCGEKSKLVCYFLSQQPGPLTYYRVSLWPNSHGFVVMDQEPSVIGGFPDNFNDWNDQAVIIDPWIGICAPARHYPELWQMKLDTMAAVGIELRTPFYEEGKWVRADVSYWKNMLERNKKYATVNHDLFASCLGLFSWRQFIP